MTLVDDESREYIAAYSVELPQNMIEDSSSEEINVSDEEIDEDNVDASDLDNGGKTLRILNYKKRKLESIQVNCEFNQSESVSTLTYKERSVLITSDLTNKVQVESSFSVSFIGCGTSQDPETIAKLKLSY